MRAVQGTDLAMLDTGVIADIEEVLAGGGDTPRASAEPDGALAAAQAEIAALRAPTTRSCGCGWPPLRAAS